MWQRRFASDASIVGRSIEVDGTPHEVVGIAPPGFDFPMGTQLWAPLSFTAETAANRRSQYLTLIGRLAPGRTLEEAQAQMATVGERLSREYQETNKGREMRVYTIADGMMDLGLKPNPLDVAGVGRLRAPHRLRERRKPAAGARRRAAARDGRPARDRRQPRTRRP